MARQYAIPGWGYVNSTENGLEYAIPGWVEFNQATTATPTPTPSPSPTSTAGTGFTSHKRRDERWSLTLDGKPMVFSSLDALIAFLDSREAVEVEDAQEKAETDAKRIVNLGRAKAKPAPPQVRIASPVAEIVEYVDAVQAKIDRLYWRALGEALAREAEEDEDVAFIATLDV